MTAPTPASVHEREHRPGDQSKCRQCAEGWATCQRKRTYRTVRTAHGIAVGHNVVNEWVRPLVPYRCCYCTFWHLKTAKTKVALKRVRQMRHKVERMVSR